MTELVIYRGLPASGKTTRAKAWVAMDPTNRARVNRDSLRQMLHGGYVNRESERVARIARDRLIKALLDQGVSVACDDTNLSQQTARDVARIGTFAGAIVTVIDLTHVPVEVCIERDQLRPAIDMVGEDVIRDHYERWLKGRELPLPLPVDARPVEAPVPYVPEPGTPKAIMVDLDGTLCLHDGRSPYNETLVHTDKPNRAVVEAVRAAAAQGYQIVFCSGRSENARKATAEWIHEHVGPFDRSSGDLLMRKSGDTRRDSIVKREMFDADIRDYYDVVYVLDDRQQVVDAWREIGLTVFQVAKGDF